MVCDPDHQCNQTGPVDIEGPFTLWYVLGREDWASVLEYGKRRGFISRGKTPHEKITTDAHSVATFAGKPSCFDGKYGICVGGRDQEKVGVGPACPADRIWFKMNYRNLKMCQRFVFKEITYILTSSVMKNRKVQIAR